MARVGLRASQIKILLHLIVNKLIEILNAELEKI